MTSGARLTALAALSFVAATACSGASGGGLGGVLPTPAASQPQGGTSATAPGPSGRPGASRTLTAAQLSRAIPPDPGFPEGWDIQTVPDPLTADPAGTGGPQCDVVENTIDFADSTPAADHTVMRVASSPQDTAIAGVAVAAFDDGRAAERMRVLKRALGACSRFTQSQNGVTLSIAVSRSEAPKFGDEAVAVQLISTGNVPSGGFGHSYVLVRTGDVIVGVSLVILTGPYGVYPNDELVRDQVKRVGEALGKSG